MKINTKFLLITLCSLIIISTLGFINNFETQKRENYKNSPFFLVQNINNNKMILDLTSQIYPSGIPLVKSSFIRKKYGGSGIKVGILDTGVDYNHKDLNIKGGISLIDKSNNYMDYSGHGTHVAGIVGSLDNGIGTIGIAPNVQLFAIKALDYNEKGKISNIIAGVQWAIDNEIDILNMSVGAPIYSKDLKNVLEKAYLAGMFIVAPVGNNGFSYQSNILYPAKFPTVFAVGSVDKNLQRSRFSNVGNELDIMAPGEKIISTFINNKYAYGQGTSMASPLVAGAAAVLLSADPTLTNIQISAILKISAKRRGDTYEYSNGVLDVSKALDIVLLKKKDTFLYNFIVGKFTQNANLTVVRF
ncbi:peptidase S8 [Bacillus sp. AFS076308]|uniref:S8 family peptidase n=1 Tax=unclassified Bacillus (in: firmicutes) TaxID=185979 RepID=UPI000BF80C1B|nr:MULTISPECIES: S8 family peptidase [unclassified Bacillus (in: firmicutes)]PFN83627.1 peptidase S8 [Bacillus sp. AFS076308]PGV48618.1 peptidase S8 [Bacillus sp. AFS037270]